MYQKFANKLTILPFRCLIKHSLSDQFVYVHFDNFVPCKSELNLYQYLYIFRAEIIEDPINKL